MPGGGGSALTPLFSYGILSLFGGPVASRCRTRVMARLSLSATLAR